MGWDSSLLLHGLVALDLASSVAASSKLVHRTWNDTKYGCRCYYDDDCWPAADVWAKLNTTVGGNLMVDVPPGAVCHDKFHGPLGIIDTYDAAACADAKANFTSEQWT